MLSHVAGVWLATAPRVLIAIPETINNWSPTADPCHLPGGPQAPANAYTSFQEEVHKHQQVQLLMGKMSKKDAEKPSCGQPGRLWWSWEQSPQPHPLIFDLTETGGNSPWGWETLWSPWGKDYSSLFFVHGSKHSIQSWKNKKNLLKMSTGKPPNHFVPVARPKTFCWWVAGWDEKKFHYKMKGFTLLPPAKICITLSMLKGCQLPLSHLPHGKCFEQLQQKKEAMSQFGKYFFKASPLNKFVIWKDKEIRSQLHFCHPCWRQQMGRPSKYHYCKWYVKTWSMAWDNKNRSPWQSKLNIFSCTTFFAWAGKYKHIS